MNVEFVNQVGGSCVLVDDKEYVADVNVDGALQFWLEVHVAAHGFPVANGSELPRRDFLVHQIPQP